MERMRTRVRPMLRAMAAVLLLGAGWASAAKVPIMAPCDIDGGGAACCGEILTSCLRSCQPNDFQCAGYCNYLYNQCMETVGY